MVCSFKLDEHNNIHLISSGIVVVIQADDILKLKLIYEQLYPGKSIAHFPQFFHKF